MPQQTFAQRLTLAMERKGLKQRQVAAAVGVTAQAVCAWQNGGAIKLDNMEPLARFLGVSPAWLAFGDAAASQQELATLRAMRERLREVLHDAG